MSCREYSEGVTQKMGESDIRKQGNFTDYQSYKKSEDKNENVNTYRIGYSENTGNDQSAENLSGGSINFTKTTLWSQFYTSSLYRGRCRYLATYCDIAQFLVNPSTYHVFSSIARVPFQTLEQLARRVPVTQLTRKTKLLLTMGIIKNTRANEDSAAKYYVDLVEFWRTVCVKLAAVRSLAEVDAGQLIGQEPAKQSGSMGLTARVPEHSINPGHFRSASGLVNELVNCARTKLMSTERENLLEGCGNRSGGILDYWEEGETSEAKNIQDCSVYGVLDELWVPDTPSSGSQFVTADALRFVKWMEEDVRRKKLDVSLETFFSKIMHSCAYIRNVIDELNFLGETLLAERIQHKQKQKIYTVKYCVLNYQVVDCITDQCLLCGLVSPSGVITLGYLQKQVHNRLGIRISVVQVHRVIRHLVNIETGILYIETSKTVTWKIPWWLHSQSKLLAYLQDLAVRGRPGAGFLTYLHKFLARCGLEIRDPGELVPYKFPWGKTGLGHPERKLTQGEKWPPHPPQPYSNPQKNPATKKTHFASKSLTNINKPKKWTEEQMTINREKNNIKSNVNSELDGYINLDSLEVSPYDGNIYMQEEQSNKLVENPINTKNSNHDSITINDNHSNQGQSDYSDQNTYSTARDFKCSKLPNNKYWPKKINKKKYKTKNYGRRFYKIQRLINEDKKCEENCSGYKGPGETKNTFQNNFPECIMAKNNDYDGEIFNKYCNAAQGVSQEHLQCIYDNILNYTCTPIMYRFFARLCRLEKDIYCQRRGVWVNGREGMTIFVYEPSPPLSLVPSLRSAPQRTFVSVRQEIRSLVWETLKGYNQVFLDDPILKETGDEGPAQAIKILGIGGFHDVKGEENFWGSSPLSIHIKNNVPQPDWNIVFIDDTVCSTTKSKSRKTEQLIQFDKGDEQRENATLDLLLAEMESKIHSLQLKVSQLQMQRLHLIKNFEELSPEKKITFTSSAKVVKELDFQQTQLEEATSMYSLLKQFRLNSEEKNTYVPLQFRVRSPSPLPSRPNYRPVDIIKEVQLLAKMIYDREKKNSVKEQSKLKRKIGFRAYNGQIVLNPYCIDPCTRDLMENMLGKEKPPLPTEEAPLVKPEGKESMEEYKKRRRLERRYNRRVFVETQRDIMNIKEQAYLPLFDMKGSDTDEDDMGHEREMLRRRLRNKFFKHLREIHEEEIWNYDREARMAREKPRPCDFFKTNILNQCDGLTKEAIRDRVQRFKLQQRENKDQTGVEDEGNTSAEVDEEIIRQIEYHKHCKQRSRSPIKDRMARRLNEIGTAK